MFSWINRREEPKTNECKWEENYIPMNKREINTYIQNQVVPNQYYIDGFDNVTANYETSLAEIDQNHIDNMENIRKQHQDRMNKEQKNYIERMNQLNQDCSNFSYIKTYDTNYSYNIKENYPITGDEMSLEEMRRKKDEEFMRKREERRRKLNLEMEQKQNKMNEEQRIWEEQNKKKKKSGINISKKKELIL